jgi:beta-galactosidase
MDPAEFAADQPVLIAAGLAITTDAELDWYESYAAAGGHLIVGIRTGYQDHEARARIDRKPARLDAAAGVFYDEFSTLRNPLPVTAPARSAFRLSPGADGPAGWMGSRLPAPTCCSGTPTPTSPGGRHSPASFTAKAG